MSLLPAYLRLRLEAQLTTKLAQLTAANTSYTAALSNLEIETYSLNTGEATQLSKRRSPTEIATAIRLLESEIDRLYRRLDGTGLVNLNLRRTR